MLNEGIDLMGPGGMLSAAHSEEDVSRTVEAFRATVRRMKAEGTLPPPQTAP